MSDKVKTYSDKCNCITCMSLRDSMGLGCSGCSYRHNEVVTLTAEVECWKVTAGIEAAIAEEQIQEVKSLLKKVEEAKNQLCPTCIARRGIDTCRPDEEFHVTHYDAEEMNMHPLPDKPCECGDMDRATHGVHLNAIGGE